MMSGITDYFFGRASSEEDKSKSLEMSSLSEKTVETEEQKLSSGDAKSAKDGSSEHSEVAEVFEDSDFKGHQSSDLLDVYPRSTSQVPLRLGVTQSFTYIDFFPRVLIQGAAGTLPKFDSFSSLLVQANQWLEGNPQFCVFKCETIRKKLLPGPKIDFDDVLHHESSNGRNSFLYGLRLWLNGQNVGDGSTTFQQIGCYHSVPWRCSDQNLGENSPEKYKLNPYKFYKLNEKMKELNLALKRSPLQGEILTVESVCLRSSEEMAFPAWSPERTCWMEDGSQCVNCITVMRIFYILGEPAKEQIGIKDFVPKITKAPLSNVTKPKFEPFSEIVKRAKYWLETQENVTVINTESMSYRLQQNNDGSVHLLREQMHYEEPANEVTLYLKMLTVFYIEKSSPGQNTKICLKKMNVTGNVNERKMDNSESSASPEELKSGSAKVHATSSTATEGDSVLTSSNSANVTSSKPEATMTSSEPADFTTEHTENVMSSDTVVMPTEQPSVDPVPCLTCKVFPPLRRGAQSFESFSRTVDRTSYWIKCTKAPLVTIETRQSLFSPNMFGSGVKEEVVLWEVNRQLGRLYLTSLWGYFSGPLEEVTMEQVAHPYVTVDKPEGLVV